MKNAIKLNCATLNKLAKSSFIYNLPKNYFSESSKLNDKLKNADKTQLNLLKENLILVDNEDNKIGELSKLDAHLIQNNNKYPHRAFSLLLLSNKAPACPK